MTLMEHLSINSEQFAIDPTEFALYSVTCAAEDFKLAIRHETNPHRLAQLRERLKLAVKYLTDAQDAAADRHEAVTRAR